MTPGTRYWVASSSGYWNNSSNWSTTSGGAGGSPVPTFFDIVMFDGNGGGNCTLDQNITVGSLNFSGYNGEFSASSYNVLVTDGGVTTSTTQTLSMGSGTWTLYGGGDFRSAGTLSQGTATVVVRESGAVQGQSNELYKYIIDYGANVSANWGLSAVDTDVRGKLTNGNCTHGDREYTIRGSGAVVFTHSTCGHNQSTGPVTIDGSYTSTSERYFAVEGPLVFGGAGVINSPVYLYGKNGAGSSQTVTIPAATDLLITGDLFANSKYSITYIIDNTAGGKLQFGADVSLAETNGTLVWGRGSPVAITGAVDQQLTLLGKNLGDLVIDKAGGKAVLSDSVNAASLSVQNGSLDLNAGTLNISGDMTIAQQGLLVSAGLAGASVSVGGEFEAYGRAGNMLNLAAPAGWTLSVSGFATTLFTEFSYCDASGGSAVTALEGIDSGNNQNIDF